MTTSLLIAVCTTAALQAGSPTLTVHVDRPMVEVSPTLYGIFFEEINHAGDGGLYAEMVRNRSFEDSGKPEHWRLAPGSSGSIEILSHEGATGHNRRFLRIVSHSSAGVVNGGYWGMDVRQGREYNLTVRARQSGAGPVEALFESENGKRLGAATLQMLRTAGSDWMEGLATIRATGTDPKARLVVRLTTAGTLDLDFVSTFPAQTFRNRPFGMRRDLGEKLAELQPAFVRFPGGCWVEGDRMATSLRWKQTIGPLVERRTQPNLWGYQSTNGLGFHEYLQLCEDLKAEPLFVINCGMSHREVVPMDQMDEYVQDALDAIEYANGPADGGWGALRAKNGHPEPFGLKYLEIGNENGGPAYNERYALFFKAIKAKHPEVRLIANLWGGLPTSAPIEIVDEHYYNGPAFFIQNADRYDSYDRNGPKIYVGEYAVTQGCGNGNLIGALAEAAFMTGMERNSDVVAMSSYAPLFAHVSGKAWNPDLIYFDSSRSFGTPSYYVQQMFATNRPDVVLKAEMANAEEVRGSFSPGGIGVGTWNTQAEFKEIRVVSGDRVLFESADGSTLQRESGDWKIEEGALRQTGNAEPSRAFVPGADWTDYTLTLKARKISGKEGFLISVGRRDRDNYLWWNLGGWGNTVDGMELAQDGGKSLIGRQVPSKIETGRWYDIRIEYGRERVRCYLDGELAYDVGFPASKPLHVVAGKSKGEVIVKVVNVSNREMQTKVILEGFKASSAAGSATVLTGPSMTSENSLDRPNLVAPKRRSFTFQGNGFDYRFPARSLTILRWRLPRG